jgi:hypothetical protein
MSDRPDGAATDGVYEDTLIPDSLVDEAERL